MSDLSLFLLIASICIVIITGTIVYVAKDFVLTLRKLQTVLEDVEETTNDINTVKNGIKYGIVSIISNLATDKKNKLEKGGEN
jgi:hypothetical protein